MGDEHQGQGVLQSNGRRIQAKSCDQPGIQVPPGPQERGKGGRNDHGGHDKGNGGQGAEQRLAPKLVPGKDIGRRHPDQKGQEGGQERLAGGKGQQMGIVRVSEQDTKRRNVQPPLGGKAQPKNLDQGVKEKQAKKSQGKQIDQAGGSFAAARPGQLFFF